MTGAFKTVCDFEEISEETFFEFRSGFSGIFKKLPDKPNYEEKKFFGYALPIVGIDASGVVEYGKEIECKFNEAVFVWDVVSKKEMLYELVYINSYWRERIFSLHDLYNIQEIIATSDDEALQKAEEFFRKKNGSRSYEWIGFYKIGFKKKIERKTISEKEGN